MGNQQFAEKASQSLMSAAENILRRVSAELSGTSGQPRREAKPSGKAAEPLFPEGSSGVPL